MAGALALALAVTAATAAPAAAGTFTVDRFDDTAAATGCLDATPNDCSLRGAIRAANLDAVETVVVLPDGLYRLTVEGGSEDFALTGDLDVRDDGLTLVAAAGAHPVIEQGTDDRIFHVDLSAGAVVFQGPMTLRGGAAANPGGSERGGSIYFFRAQSLALTDVELVDGFATDSGGCLEWAAPLNPGSLTLTRVSFTGCGTDGDGGGFRVQNAGSPVTFDRVTARDNGAGALGGGGRFLAGSAAVVVYRSSFEHNTAGALFGDFGWGGGLYLSGGSNSIYQSTVAHNTAGRTGGVASYGGGLYVAGGLLLLRNVTLSQNRVLTVSGDGADLALQGSTVELQSSTVRETVSAFPESIDVDSTSDLTFFASVLEADCAGSGTITSDGVNVEHPPEGGMVTQCNLSHPSDELSDAPLLAPLAGYGGPTATHALLPSAVGTTFIVPNGDCPDTDQRGADRLGFFCHSGAYEAGVQPPGPWIFADGFESGDLAAWSAAVP
jgi:hypothetical protein